MTKSFFKIAFKGLTVCLEPKEIFLPIKVHSLPLPEMFFLLIIYLY